MRVRVSETKDMLMEKEALRNSRKKHLRRAEAVRGTLAKTSTRFYFPVPLLG